MLHIGRGDEPEIALFFAGYESHQLLGPPESITQNGTSVGYRRAHGHVQQTDTQTQRHTHTEETLYLYSVTIGCA